MSPLVSVVMPTFNRAGMLPRSIQAVLDQDFRDIELIIVDDGSTDNTAEVINSIQSRDSRVCYVRLPHNCGIGLARDEGLQHVYGRYVALADSDDYWLPRKLSYQVETLIAFPEIEILFSDFLNIDHVTGTQNTGFDQTIAGLNCLDVLKLREELYLVQQGLEIGILKKNFVQPATLIIKADVFDKVGRFNRALSTPVDLEFCWRAAVLGAKYAYSERILLERHRYPSSVTARAVAPWAERIKALEICHATSVSVQRSDLLGPIRAAEQQSWHNMIVAYGRQKNRPKVIATYRQSMRTGNSWQTFIFAVVAFLGPRALRSFQKLLGSTKRLRGT